MNIDDEFKAFNEKLERREQSLNRQRILINLLIVLSALFLLMGMVAMFYFIVVAVKV